AVAFAILRAAPGCETPIEQSPCKGVPDGGCPLSHGRACEDPACAAAYACNADGTWTLDHMCPAHADSSASAPDAAPGDAGAIDAPPGASGGPECTALEAPDCPLATALACPSGCCDCTDLFVCGDGGWNEWGTCDPDAGIRPALSSP